MLAAAGPARRPQSPFHLKSWHIREPGNHIYTKAHPVCSTLFVNALCATCKMPDDIARIFLVCPAYDREHQHLFSTLHAGGRRCSRANGLLFSLGTPAAVLLVFVAMCLFFQETRQDDGPWTKAGYFGTRLSFFIDSSFLLHLTLSTFLITISYLLICDGCGSPRTEAKHCRRLLVVSFLYLQQLHTHTQIHVRDGLFLICTYLKCVFEIFECFVVSI